LPYPKTLTRRNKSKIQTMGKKFLRSTEGKQEATELEMKFPEQTELKICEES
jgi:hypothetical protein